jgi:predicted permease
VALSLPLLVAALLLARSLVGLSAVPLGFDPEGVLTLRLELSGARYSEEAQRLALQESLLAALAAAPEIEAVGTTSSLPLTGLFDLRMGMTLDNDGTASPREITAGFRLVSPGYFDTLRIPRLSGRALVPADREGAPLAAVVNQTFARTAWPGRSPLGRKLTLPSSGEVLEVVGVVGDVRHAGPETAPEPEVFLSFAQSPVTFLTLVLRGRGEPEALVARVRAVLREVDPHLAAKAVRPLETVVRRALAGPRFHAVLAGLLAAAAVGLAAAGLYGVTAYAVSRRTREIGLRLALGADRPGVLVHVLGGALRPVALGVLLGLAAAVPLTRLLADLLVGVSPGDPALYVLAALVPLVVGLAAAWLPARRAARVEPMAALRRD